MVFQTGIFDRIKTKQDFDREAELFEQARRASELQQRMGSLNEQQATLQLEQLRRQMQNPTLSTEELLARAIAGGGVESLSPEQAAQLKAADIAQRAKQTVDARGNVIQNQSYLDLLNQAAAPQVLGAPPAAVLSRPMQAQPAPQAQAPMMGQQGMAAQAGGTPRVDVTPEMLQGLSPFTQEDVLKEAAIKNLEMQREQAQEVKDRQSGAVKAARDLKTFAQDTNNMLRTIDKAVSDVSPYTAGLGSWLSILPGTPATNLASTLKTIQADAAFDRLQQMRDSSKTGGALGQVSERELALLQNARAALDQDQSPAQLRENLINYRRIRENALRNVAEAYKEDYGSYPDGFEESFFKGAGAGRLRYNPQTGRIE